MKTALTQNQERLSKKYLTYQALVHMWFVSAVWLYFYRLFITDTQVGIMDAMAFAIGLLAEIPSGALADRFGRDRLVKAGQVLTGLGLIIQAFAIPSNGFFIIFIGQSIMMIGVAFVSGADEALFFEKLKFDRNSAEWKKLVTRGSQFALASTLLATIIGGLLHEINPRLPWILTGVAFISSLIVIWNIKDSRLIKKSISLKEELSDYFNNISTGFREFKKPKLAIYVPIILSIQALFYANGYGLLRIVLLDRFTFSPLWGSIAVASASLISIYILHLLHKYAEKITEKQVILFVGLSAITSLLLSLANIGLWGYVVIVALYAGERILYPTMSESINNNATDNQRATTLSIASFLKSVPYVILAIAIGYLNDQNQIEVFLVSWSLIIGIALFVYFKNKQLNLSN